MVRIRSRESNAFSEADEQQRERTKYATGLPSARTLSEVNRVSFAKYALKNRINIKSTNKTARHCQVQLPGGYCF